MAENHVQAVSIAEEVSHVSPTNEVECSPFWNAVTKEISELLWLPTEKGSVYKSVKTLTSNSWFSVSLFFQTSNLQMDSSMSSSSLSLSIMDLVQQKIAEKQNSLHLLSLPNEKKRKINNENEKPPAEKSIKILLYPTKEEQQRLRNWIGCSCWTYNECVRVIEEEKIPRFKKALRARVLNEEAIN